MTITPAAARRYRTEKASTGVGIGLALQLVALAFAPVALVQPLGVTSVLVAALIALLGYNCFVAGAVGTSGFFTANVVEQVFGWHTPWQLWSLLSAAAVFALTNDFVTGTVLTVDGGGVLA